MTTLNIQAELLEALKDLIASPLIQKCPHGDWSLADGENYWRRRKAEDVITKAEGR